MPALIRTRSERRRADRRLLGRFVLVMAIVTVCFIAALTGRYGLGWW